MRRSSVFANLRSMFLYHYHQATAVSGVLVSYLLAFLDVEDSGRRV